MDGGTADRGHRLRGRLGRFGAGGAFQTEEVPAIEASARSRGDGASAVSRPRDVGSAPTWVERISELAAASTSEVVIGPTLPVVSAAEAGSPAVRTATPAELGSRSSFVAAPSAAPLDVLPAPVCVDGTDVDDLIELFDRREPMLGADYQRAYALPHGRVLWLFQDAFLATSHGPELVHNAGLLQSGNCFQLLRSGTFDRPGSYLLPELTDRFDRWFWPMGGEMGTDGLLHVFVVEMHEHSAGYLERTIPVATWLIDIDPGDLQIVAARPAPDDSDALYGWSVVSDEAYTYLYAHCYRQFGWDPLWFAPDVLAHDYDCSADVTVARVPLGAFTAAPEYWDGSGWSGDRASAAPVIPTDGRPVNPTQVAYRDGTFVAVTKVGDWWGDTIVLDVAPEATGPWTTYGTVEVTPECDGCNTYFASIVPYGADETSFAVGLSCNTWTGECTEHYTPTFLRVPFPD